MTLRSFMHDSAAFDLITRSGARERQPQSSFDILAAMCIAVCLWRDPAAIERVIARPQALLVEIAQAIRWVAGFAAKA